MKIVYLFNSSIPSYNANSLQVANMCNHIAKLIGEVVLITPNTGLNTSISDHYGIKKKFRIIKIKKFNTLPRGVSYYLYSLFSIILGLKLKPNIFITRNYFTLFLLLLLRKKVIFEVHTGLEFEGKINNFIIKNFNIFNSNKIINLVFITDSIKKNFFNKYKIKSKKVTVLNSASNLSSNYPILKKKAFFKIGYFGLVNKSRGINFICRLSKIDLRNKYYIYGCTREYLNKYKKKIYK